MFEIMKKSVAMLVLVSSSAFCITNISSLTDITDAELEKQIQEAAAMCKTYKIKCRDGVIVVCCLAKANDVHIEPQTALPWSVKYFVRGEYNPATFTYCYQHDLGRHVTHDQYCAIVELLTKGTPHQYTGEQLESRLSELIMRR